MSFSENNGKIRAHSSILIRTFYLNLLILIISVSLVQLLLKFIMLFLRLNDSCGIPMGSLHFAHRFIIYWRFDIALSYISCGTFLSHLTFELCAMVVICSVMKMQIFFTASHQLPLRTIVPRALICAICIGRTLWAFLVVFAIIKWSNKLSNAANQPRGLSLRR